MFGPNFPLKLPMTNFSCNFTKLGGLGLMNIPPPQSAIEPVYLTWRVCRRRETSACTETGAACVGGSRLSQGRCTPTTLPDSVGCQHERTHALWVTEIWTNGLLSTLPGYIHAARDQPRFPGMLSKEIHAKY